jgi:hypothetical protein
VTSPVRGSRVSKVAVAVSLMLPLPGFRRLADRR